MMEQVLMLCCTEYKALYLCGNLTVSKLKEGKKNKESI